MATATPLPRWLWAGCLLGAWPVAATVAQAGFGWPLSDMPRDLAVLTLGAVAEEIVFRGGLQRALGHWRSFSGRIGPVSVANLVTSVLFAAAHVWGHPPVIALGVFPVSLLLGWAYERSGGRLWPPAALHLYFNAVLYACSLLVTNAAGRALA